MPSTEQTINTVDFTAVLAVAYHLWSDLFERLDDLMTSMGAHLVHYQLSSADALPY